MFNVGFEFFSPLTPMSDSYFPRWTLREGGVIAPDERLPAGQTIALGVQHVVAMFGATVLAPLLMGFDPNVAILFSGIGTLIFFAAVGGRVPSYLGSSFSFIAVVIAATAYAGSGPNANISGRAGRDRRGRRPVRRRRPRRHEGRLRLDRDADAAGGHGAVVAVIGLNLAPIAVKGISGGTFDTWIGIATIVAVGLVAVRAPGPRAPAADPARRARRLRAVRDARPTALGLAKPIDFARGRRRAVDRPAEVRRAGMERPGHGADRAGGHRARRGEPGPCQSGRRDDWPESGSRISAARSWATASPPSSRARAAAPA